jgi:hypothetical protein
MFYTVRMSLLVLIEKSLISTSRQLVLPYLERLYHPLNVPDRILMNDKKMKSYQGQLTYYRRSR